ncbi:hypothetical protein [Rhizobium leguminosarum]|uniref:hypothetical protein n=1 Tax=Rhizobium leguminosarum TaxID=384 RepID=UPI0015F8C6DB|nr:hypothetical protein [Rhizobium leguminosarum]MBA9036181.1 hypothetical protein [Rhizobium leguminosarum]
MSADRQRFCEPGALSPTRRFGSQSRIPEQQAKARNAEICQMLIGNAVNDAIRECTILQT